MNTHCERHPHPSRMGLASKLYKEVFLPFGSKNPRPSGAGFFKRFILSMAAGVLLLGSAGCTHDVFHKPITLSTKSAKITETRRLKPVDAESCNFFFLLLPIPSDPRDIYDDLLQKAKDAGGNGVVDFQLREKSFFFWMFPPIMSQCVEAMGTAVLFE